MAAGTTEYAGLIKVRLVHASGRSLIMPDMAVVTGEAVYWLQPHWFYPSILIFDGDGKARLKFTAANVAGRDDQLEATFSADGLVTSLEDRSQIYRCTIYGPTDLHRFKAGRAQVRNDGGVDLRLYHHTFKAAKKKIRQSGVIRGSKWNYRGNKQLANCSYAYFTSLERIAGEADLRRIGMSGAGPIELRRDTSPDGSGADVLISVYREQIENRTERVALWVPAEHVAPSHVWDHARIYGAYESAHPWIFRVGLKPCGEYVFDGDRARRSQMDAKRFDYVILGDCDSNDGLSAPFDEENTESIFKFEDLGDASIFQFWLNHKNQDRMGEVLDMQQIIP